MSAGPAAAVAVDNLRKSFGAVHAVDGITFELAAGSVLGLLGGNGAGKTTTIAMLLGLLLPDAGAIRILGRDMLKHRQELLAEMNFSSPYVDLPKRLTVRENLMVYGRLYGLIEVRGRIAELADELDLGSFIDRATGSLSSGQATRVSLAKSLLNDPKLLLLDEPTASLDPDTGDWVRGYLESWRRRTGATVILASHNMAEVERLCDRVLMMRRGRIVDDGAPADLIARHGRRNLEEVFLVIARAETDGAAA